MFAIEPAPGPAPGPGLATDRVLVIRLGALGDIVQSFAAFAAIRAHHAGAHVTLLTTEPYAGWLGAAPWFDAVSVDARPSLRDIAGLVRLARRLRGFGMVYDLQTSGRSTRYFWLAGRPRWSGIGWWRSHPHRDAGRDRLHTRERQRGQLRDAGIAPGTTPIPVVPASLLAPPPARLAGPYAVLVPGAAAHRPDKRWPTERFAALARVLVGRGYRVVVAGAAADRTLGATIGRSWPGVTDLCGRTTLAQLAGVLAGAALVVGNDTGPMHLAAALGRRCVVLFGGASDPALTAPRLPDGAFVTVLRAADLATLEVDRVAAASA